MRVLLDTHSFLWFIVGASRLSEHARQIIADLENDAFVSTASLWEIAIKVSIGKLEMTQSYEEFIPEQLKHQKIAVLGINWRISARSPRCRSTTGTRSTA